MADFKPTPWSKESFVHVRPCKNPEAKWQAFLACLPTHVGLGNSEAEALGNLAITLRQVASRPPTWSPKEIAKLRHEGIYNSKG